MGNIDSNSTELNIENLNIPKNNNTLEIVIDDPKLDKISIKKAKQKMTYKSKHNKDLLDSDLIEGALLGHYYLGILSKQARQEIVEQMSQYIIQENEDVFKQGDHPTYLYILSQGTCHLFIDGEKKGTLNRGSLFGELSLLYNCNREMTVHTMSECTFWTLEKKNFTKIMDHILNICFEENKRSLECIPLFSSLDVDTKNKLINNIYKESYYAYKPVFLKGDIAHSIYFIKEGQVDIVKDGNVIQTLKEGDYLGEISVLCKTNRLYDAVTKTNCNLLSLPVAYLYYLCRDHYHIELMLAFIRAAFVNVPSFKKLNCKFFNEIYYLFKLEYFEKEKIILKKGTKVNEYIIIPIEGNLMNCNDLSVICERGQLLFGEEIYNNEKTSIDYDIKCSDYSVIIKIKTIEVINHLKCSFKESVEKSSALQQLKKVNLFKNLPIKKLKDIFAKIKIDKIKKGKNIMTQGEEGNRFYIVKKGTVDIYVNGKYIRTLNTNTYLGERALFFKEPRSATCTAHEDCEVYFLEKEDFENVIENNLKDYLKKRLYLQDESVQLNQLVFFKSLGQGSYGNVSLVKSEKNNYFYAIKNISNKQILYSKLHQNIELERSILLKVDHPFIVKLVKTLKDDNYIYYLMDYIKGKELFDVIRDIGLLNKNIAQFYIGSMMLALKYLHERHIIFRDVKPENIMVLENGFIQLIDFGAAKNIEDRTNSIIGTPQYMAPEVILGDQYSFEVDYWSVGICLYEFVYGEIPFGQEASQVIEIYSSIINE